MCGRPRRVLLTGSVDSAIGPDIGAVIVRMGTLDFPRVPVAEAEAAEGEGQRNPEPQLGAGEGGADEDGQKAALGLQTMIDYTIIIGHSRYHSLSQQRSRSPDKPTQHPKSYLDTD